MLPEQIYNSPSSRPSTISTGESGQGVDEGRINLTKFQIDNFKFKYQTTNQDTGYTVSLGDGEQLNVESLNVAGDLKIYTQAMPPAVNIKLKNISMYPFSPFGFYIDDPTKSNNEIQDNNIIDNPGSSTAMRAGIIQGSFSIPLNYIKDSQNMSLSVANLNSAATINYLYNKADSENEKQLVEEFMFSSDGAGVDSSLDISPSSVPKMIFSAENHSTLLQSSLGKIGPQYVHVSINSMKETRSSQQIISSYEEWKNNR